jgi:hypothetical protein
MRLLFFEPARSLLNLGDFHSSVEKEVRRQANKLFAVPNGLQSRAREVSRDTAQYLRERDNEAALTADIIALALQYGRYGYRRIATLLREAGWPVSEAKECRAAKKLRIFAQSAGSEGIAGVLLKPRNCTTHNRMPISR